MEKEAWPGIWGEGRPASGTETKTSHNASLEIILMFQLESFKIEEQK